MVVVGFQAMLFRFFARAYAGSEGFLSEEAYAQRVLAKLSLERGIVLGAVIGIAGDSRAPTRGSPGSAAVFDEFGDRDSQARPGTENGHRECLKQPDQITKGQNWTIWPV